MLLLSDTKTRIRDHIISSFLFDDVSEMLPDNASLLWHGIVDSTGVLDLVMFLEEEFGFAVADEDVIPAHFDSVDSLVSYTESKAATAMAA